MKRAAKWTGIALVCVFALASCGGISAPFEFVVYMFAGWVMFLVRVLPAVQLNFTGLVSAAAALLAFAVGLHFFLRWLYGATTLAPAIAAEQSSNVHPPRPAWRGRWTAEIVAILLLMFVAGISMIGATHQLVWLVTSTEPIIESGGARGAARRLVSTQKLGQIGQALKYYDEAHRAWPAGASVDDHGRMLHSWLTMILPYIEESDLYRQIEKSRPWNDPLNAAHFQKQVDTYFNPSVGDGSEHDSAGFAVSHYAGNVYVLGGDQPRKPSDLTDGLSETILAGEAAGDFKAWGGPGNWRDPRLGLNKSPDGFGGNRPYTTIFLFGDGSVRAIDEDIDPAVFRALCTPNGGETIPEEYRGYDRR